VSLLNSGTTTFHIQNDNSGRCIGIAPGQNLAGDWTCVNHNDQLWHLDSCLFALINNLQYEFCRIMNGNNKCLGVEGALRTRGAHISNWTCNVNADQL
jgi:Ricin-type beta-trefoil lectin domain-like